MMGIANLAADGWRVDGWSVTIHPTEGAGHATTLAREAAEAGHQLLLAMGGDGTLGEAANGLIGSKTALGVLPTGTANSFAVELGLPLPRRFNDNSLLKANNALRNGRIHKMDVGYLESRTEEGIHFLLWVGIGIDSMVVEHVEPRSKWLRRFGRSGYIAKGLLALPHITPFEAEIEIDGRFYNGRYMQILISNCRRYSGSFNLSPRAALDDGKFQIWLFTKEQLPHLAEYLWRTRTSDLVDLENLTMINGRSITIHTAAPTLCQADGDQHGTTPLRCHLKPQALRILVPPSIPEGLFTVYKKLSADFAD